MLLTQLILLQFINILIGLFLGLLAWGLLRARSHGNTILMGARDNLLLGLLVFASFAMGVFLTYALLGSFVGS